MAEPHGTSTTSVASQALGPFRVRVWSAGSGPPLLYLHGFEQHPGDAHFLRQLALNHRVLAPEHPGYGESSGFAAIDELLDLILYYRQLIASWDLETVDVIGHCLGGMFAAELAALCPRLVRRLVLVNAYGLWRDDQPLPDPFVLGDRRLRAAKWYQPEAAPEPEPSLDSPTASTPEGARLVRIQNLATATKFLWPIPDRGLRKRLPLIEAPTLVVHGAADGLIPAVYADELTALIPNARLSTIPEAGHLPMIEREDEFIAAVEQFLAG